MAVESTDARAAERASAADGGPLLERYRRMFNKRGEDWWSIVFGYPIGRMLVLLLPSWRWITPTLLTVVGFFAKIAAAVCLWFPSTEALIGAIAALQANTVLDTMDGTLARSRRMSSLVGAFLDKVLDGVGLFFICAVVGMRAAAEAGQPWLIVAACGAAAAYISVCYMFWIVKATEPAPQTASSLADETAAPTWGDIGRQWLSGWARIVRFSEADLYLWISVFAALGEWELLVYLLVVTQGVTLLKRGVDHCIALARRSKERS